MVYLEGDSLRRDGLLARGVEIRWSFLGIALLDAMTNYWRWVVAEDILLDRFR